MPRRGLRVVCTLWLTMAILLPTSALTKVDLPAFGGPMTAMKPQRRPMTSGSAHGTAPNAPAPQQHGCRRLLRGPLAGTFTARRLQTLDPHLGGEAGSMVRPLA